MAENGQFRNAFRGFNKQDVLQYIDQLQATLILRAEDAHLRAQAAQNETAEMAAQLSAQREAALEANAKVEEANAAAAKAAEEAAQASARADEFRMQTEKLMSLAQAYKNEILDLRETLAQVEQSAVNEEELRAANDRVAELERENALLKTQNEQYASVVGDIHRVMVKARVVSASYFETAHKNSVECLGQLDSFLDDLKAQVASNMATSNTLHEESGDRIDDLFSSLK